CGRRSRSEFEIDTVDGPFMDLPQIVWPDETIFELRHLMYRPGRGTWFTMDLVIRADSEPTAVFNYDDKPTHATSLGLNLEADLQAYPRNEIPSWIPAAIEAAREIVNSRDPAMAGWNPIFPGSPPPARMNARALLQRLTGRRGR
ncbi:hypothetical protein, partial [Nocardia acidivorans]|uniref:hypothetical protein n=1 Tax=Nocardia acidivorans TaxID=404580 RepID=UPI0035A25260